MATKANDANDATTSNTIEPVVFSNDTVPNTAAPTINEPVSPVSPPASDQKKSSVLSRIKDWSPVLVLENSGSVGASYR
jgi:hypothetical protein